MPKCLEWHYVKYSIFKVTIYLKWRYNKSAIEIPLPFPLQHLFLLKMICKGFVVI